MKIKTIKKKAVPTLATALILFTVTGCSLSKADATWDTATSTLIEMTGDGASINGAGASFSDSTPTIHSAGNYLISGQLDNGQIVVEADENDDVHLILNGVSIYNETQSPIYIKRADKVILTLADGTENQTKKSASKEVVSYDALFCGADGGNRTHGLRITGALLYR